MKKFLASILCVIMILGLVGCGKAENSKTENSSTEENMTENSGTEENKTEDNVSADTLGGKLAGEFIKEIKASKDIQDIIDKLSSEEFSGYNCGSIEVEEGFLDGFDDEIKGFKKGWKFSPMIGTIPFVNYIFETDDAEALKATLLSKANPRWNICTEAAETVCVTSGNYVFFTMCPEEE